ncbi:hypothetical protein CBS63078_10621 [Aspergillus niger]|nr:hypothetical protein CBS63078_10621 [Aspergillus niger]
MPDLLAAILPGVEMLSSKAIGQAFPLNHAKGITWYPVFIPMPPHHSMLHPHRTRQYRPREQFYPGNNGSFSSSDAGQNNGHYGHNFSDYTGTTNRDDEDSTSSYSCGEADTVADVAPSPSCCSSDIPHAMDVPAPSSIISQHLALMQMTEETESCDSVSHGEDYPPSTSGESDLRDLGDETYRRISRPPNDAASDRKRTPRFGERSISEKRTESAISRRYLPHPWEKMRYQPTARQIPRRKHSQLRTKLQVISGILILRATVLRRKPMMISSTETSAEVSEPSKIGTELQIVEPGVQVSPTLEVMFSRGTEVVADAVSSLITGVMSATEEEMEYFKPISVHMSNLFTKGSTWLGEESLIE